MKRIALAIALMCAPLTAMAQQATCAPTPQLAVQNYPGPRPIPTSNNLVQPTGKSVAAEGQQLVVRARVLDNRCVPIQGAIVELWQANPFGKFRLANRGDLATPNSIFASAGRTYTLNDGRFEFVTLFPGETAKNTAPRLFIKVMADNMRPFTTALYFANDGRNAADAGYRRLSAAARANVELSMQPIAGDPNGGFVASTDIVLPSRVRYRSY